MPAELFDAGEEENAAEHQSTSSDDQATTLQEETDQVSTTKLAWLQAVILKVVAANEMVGNLVVQHSLGNSSNTLGCSVLS